LLEAFEADINAMTSGNNQSIQFSLTVLTPIQAIPVALIKVGILCQVIHMKCKRNLSFESVGWPSCAESSTAFGNI